MIDPRHQKELSDLVITSLRQNSQAMHLSLLEEFYQTHQITYSQQISCQGRMLTKKIYGTAIKCIKESQDNDRPSSGSLKAFAYIFLQICFQDLHVMQLLLREIRQNNFNEIHFKNFPYLKLGLEEKQLNQVAAEIIKKINDWRKTFSMDDILGNYYLGVEILSLVLQGVLIKLQYQPAKSCSAKIQNTGEIYAILSDYFDINLIRTDNTPFQKKKTSADNELLFTRYTQVYLFKENSMFITTYNNQQFCIGRYYDNEDQLLTKEKTIRKSTIEYLLTKKERDKKVQQQLRISQMQIDLRVNASGFMFQQDYDTNAPTPEFGNLKDSYKFQRQQKADKEQHILNIISEQTGKIVQKTTKDKDLKESYSNPERSNYYIDFQQKQFNFDDESDIEIEFPKSPPSRENYNRSHNSQNNDIRSSNSNFRQIKAAYSRLQGSLDSEIQAERRLDKYKQCQSERDNQVEIIEHGHSNKNNITSLQNKIVSQNDKSSTPSQKNIINQKKAYQPTQECVEVTSKAYQWSFKSSEIKGGRKYSMNNHGQDMKFNRSIYSSNHLQVDKISKSNKYCTTKTTRLQETGVTLPQLELIKEQKKKMGLASNIVCVKMQGDHNRYAEIDTQNSEFKYPIISKNQEVKGFRKKQNQDNYVQLKNLNTLQNKSQSPLNSQRDYQLIPQVQQKKKKTQQIIEMNQKCRQVNITPSPRSKAKNCNHNSPKKSTNLQNNSIQKNIQSTNNNKNGDKSQKPGRKFPEFLRNKVKSKDDKQVCTSPKQHNEKSIRIKLQTLNKKSLISLNSPDSKIKETVEKSNLKKIKSQPNINFEERQINLPQQNKRKENNTQSSSNLNVVSKTTLPNFHIERQNTQQINHSTSGRKQKLELKKELANNILLLMKEPSRQQSQIFFDICQQKRRKSPHIVAQLHQTTANQRKNAKMVKKQLVYCRFAQKKNDQSCI